MRKIVMVLSAVLLVVFVSCGIGFCEEAKCQKKVRPNQLIVKEAIANAELVQTKGCVKIYKKEKDKAKTGLNSSYYGAEVFLCTEAECDYVEWYFGGQWHDSYADCEYMLSFYDVDYGYYYWEAEGCGYLWSDVIEIDDYAEYYIIICPKGTDLYCCDYRYYYGCGEYGEFECYECY